MPSDIYMHIAQIPGEAIADRKKGHIEIKSFDFGLARPTRYEPAQDGAPGCPAEARDIAITKLTDRATTFLYQHCANATLFKEILFTFCKASAGKQEDFLTIKLSKAHIVSCRTIASGEADSNARDEVIINYSKITMEYMVQSSQGDLQGASVFEFDARNKQ